MLEANKEWTIHEGDCIPFMHTVMEPESVDFSVLSPPFPSVYSFTSEACDVGNTEDLTGEAKIHLSYFYRGLKRVLKPGRVAMVHVSQIQRMKRSGGRGIFDFRGFNIRLAERAGLIFEYDWCVSKNPQSQAIRTKSHNLQFAGLERDRSNARGAIPDYLLKFVAPGENAVPIESKGEVSRNDWIQWAESCWPWQDIKETDTLNTKEAKGEEDTKHICLEKGSLVLTKERGLVPIEKLNLGENVLTHVGRWRPIIAKRKTSDSTPVVKVYAQGVHGLTVTPSHKLWCRSVNSKESRKKKAKTSLPSWVEAKDCELSYVNLKLPPVEDNGTSDDIWWIVGRWLADGHLSQRNTLHISAGHHKSDIVREKLGWRSGFEQHGTTAQILVRDPDHELRDIIERCGLGASGKKLPSEAFTLDQLKAKSLLDGYLSGDGHYNQERDRWSMTTVSRTLAVGLQFLIQRAYGVIATIHQGREGGESTILGRTVNTLTEWIVSFNVSGYTFGFIDNDGAWKPVKYVEEAGESETWNIQVEEDSSYTAEGCVVKNCPLQLGVIKRLVKLYSNPGELVFSPFAGIGSEGYEALKLGRRFQGCEIKEEYIAAQKKNLAKAIAIREAKSVTLFDDIPLATAVEVG